MADLLPIRTKAGLYQKQKETRTAASVSVMEERVTIPIDHSLQILVR